MKRKPKRQMIEWTIEGQTGLLESVAVAYTKSEARAKFKKIFGPLPKGVVVRPTREDER